MNKKRPQRATIDIVGINNDQTVIESIIQQLDFPQLYISNWNGLSEHFFYDPMQKVPFQLTVKGMESKEKTMPVTYNNLITILERYKSQNRGFEYLIA